jgi:hypothetical protein
MWVERAVGIESGDCIAAHTVDLGKAAANQNSAIDLSVCL